MNRESSKEQKRTKKQKSKLFLLPRKNAHPRSDNNYQGPETNERPTYHPD